MRKFTVDKILLIAIGIGFLLSLYGMHWETVEPWNPDQMALRPLFIEGKIPFQPTYYQKPPFHTYLNFICAEIPARILRKLLRLPYGYIPWFIFIASRLLTILLFVGSGAGLYLIVRRITGIPEARIVAFFFLTSAGIISFAHFLTADIPVVFTMIVAVYFCQNILDKGRLRDYCLAGLFVGIATATKYNALAVGIGIVTAHLLVMPKSISFGKELLQHFLSKKLLLGLICVVAGFIIANPFAVLDYRKFVGDFMYNYRVTPSYTGQASGNGYWLFLKRFPELVGWPYVFVLGIAFVQISRRLIRVRPFDIKNKHIILSLSILLLYFYKIGSFPRVPIRFVLPVIPFVMILSAFFWEGLRSKKYVLIAIVLPLLMYNVVCSFLVGKRFLQDPRVESQQWAKDNFSRDDLVLTTYFTPNWDRLHDLDIHLVQLPPVSGRGRLFKEHFKEDEFVLDYMHNFEKYEGEIHWYSHRKLNEIDPDFVGINSLYYNIFLEGQAGENYPKIKNFLADLINEEFGYKIAFDGRTKAVPGWMYPQDIDFLNNQMIILIKNQEK